SLHAVHGWPRGHGDCASAHAAPQYSLPGPWRDGWSSRSGWNVLVVVTIRTPREPRLVLPGHGDLPVRVRRPALHSGYSRVVRAELSPVQRGHSRGDGIVGS